MAAAFFFRWKWKPEVMEKMEANYHETEERAIENKKKKKN